jgi:serine/threonine protein kinase
LFLTRLLSRFQREQVIGGTAMTCVSSILLRSFLADVLPAADDERVARHLSECRDCRQLAELLCRDPEVQREITDLAASHSSGHPSPFESLRAKLYKLIPPAPPDEIRYATSDTDSLGHSAAADTGQHEISESEIRAKQWIDRELAKAETTALNNPNQGRQQVDPPIIHDRLQFVGRFHLQRRLGLGGFGVVYLAFDTVLKRQVALKLPRSIALVDSDLRRRFLREGEALASLHHQNIVPVYEAGEAHTLCYIATAYCSGPTLEKWISDPARRDGISVPQAVEIALALAFTVEHAHQAGILHRDIKPGNVLLDPTHKSSGLEFTPKLADFGLAKSIDTEAKGTSTGTMIGTPQYMAPEQASGRRDIIAATTDVYSLGVILYEMLTGKLPIAGGDNADTLRRLLIQEPILVRRHARHVSSDLEAVCMKCLEKHPHRRYRTARELAYDLRQIRDGKPTVARPDNPWQAGQRWMRRHPAQSRSLSAATIFLAVLVFEMWFHVSRLQALNGALNSALDNARVAAQRAQDSDRQQKQMLYASEMKGAYRAWSDGDYRQLARVLAKCESPVGVDCRGFEWWYFHSLAQNSSFDVGAHVGAAYFVSFSQDGKWLVSTGEDQQVRVFDGRNRSPATSGHSMALSDSR